MRNSTVGQRRSNGLDIPMVSPMISIAVRLLDRAKEPFRELD
jgi:hypothetical protein